MPVEEPDRWREVEAFPITGAWPLEEAGLLLFADFTRFVAYGPGGPEWETARLSWDGRMRRTNASAWPPA